MAKDPAFLFYPKDWTHGTAEMSPCEKGVYIDLLCHQHQNGSLPQSTEKLSRICRMHEPEFKKIWESVKEKFVPKDDRLVNARLVSESEKRATKAAKNRVVGCFAAILRTKELDAKTYKACRAAFKIDEFLPSATISDTTWLTECITTWFTTWWGTWSKSIVNGNATVNGNVNEDIREGNKNHDLVNFISQNLKYVSKIKDQLTNEQAEKITAIYTREQIAKVLNNLENYKEVGKYNSVYRTLLNWLSRDFPEQGKKETLAEREIRLAKQSIR